MKEQLRERWIRLWVSRAGTSRPGRAAAWLATLATLPYKGCAVLARYHPRGFIAPSAQIVHTGLSAGANVFIGDRVTIYQNQGGGPLTLGDRVHIHRDTIIEIGQGGSISIGADTHIQPRCQMSAYLRAIRIGRGVQIAPACAFYPYDHGMAPGRPMREQPLTSRGDIVIEDDVWIGYGAVVLSGVRIGAGAVVGANAVVTHDLPPGAIAVGTPARVIAMRGTPAAEAQHG